MLAHSRLNTRSQRPNVELVHDPPQQRLIQEVGEIAGERAHFTGGYYYIQTCKEMIGVNIKLDRIPLSVCIAESTRQLQEKLQESQAALKGLLRRQLALEEDIEIKTGSLHIDRDMCVKLRCEQLQ